MRFGIVLGKRDLTTDGREMLRMVEAYGFDLVCLEDSRSAADGFADGLQAASALAGMGTTTRVLVVVTPRPEQHPIMVAESCAVADLLLGGRLIVAVANGRGSHDAFREEVEILLRAQATRPFKHAGNAWTIPAHLEGNIGHEERVTVMPPPHQIELPVWIAGVELSAVAAEYGLPFISHHTDPPSRVANAWRALDDRLGAARWRLRRPAFVSVPSTHPADLADLYEALRDGQLKWGLDIAIIRSAGLGLEQTLDAVATGLRPRLQLDTVPSGVGQLWEQQRRSARAS
jgi:alkanesulfonate monooxygenase SsuD/methylene tetrahydromethanopterin reductase-like flavin-dependent oxidoreductase (luciferase family)